jgi:hypothetical protein
MQVSRERLLGFLFPAETDNWLTILRLGLGLQTTLYSLSLRSDWNYLLGGAGRGVRSRNVAEALLSLESHLVPRQSLVLRGFVYLLPGAAFLSELLVDSPQSSLGFFTSARPRVEGSCPMGWIIL